MKRSKKTTRLITLVCVLAAACIGTVAVLRHEEKKEQIRSANEIVLQIPADSVTALSWETDETALSFHKEENWIYDEDAAFPVDAKKITELLTPFEALQAAFIIEEAEDLSQYGLEEPTCTIHLTTADDTAYEIRLGSFSTMDAQRYVSIGDGLVYLLPEDPMELYSAQLKDMILNDDPLSYDRIHSISFSGDVDYTIEYEEDSPAALREDDVYFTDRAGTAVPLDTPSVSTFLSYMTTLKPDDYVTYKVTEEELTQYGLDEPELTVTVDYSLTPDEEEEIRETYILHIGRNRDDVKAAEEAMQQAEAEGNEDFIPESVPAYARVGDSSIVYVLSDYDYGMLSAVTFNDLRHDEVFAADFEAVTSVDVTLDGSTYTLTTFTEEDTPVVWKYDEQVVDISAFQSALMELLAETFTEETPAGQEEISLTVHLSDEAHPQIGISLYRYDGETCLAQVDGVPFALVRRSTVVDLMESVRSIVLKK